MVQQILLSFSEEELRAIVRDSVLEALNQTKPASGQKEFLNIDEASQLLMLAKQTIYGMTSNRSIPFIKRGKKLLFRRSDLEQWLDSSKKPSNEEMFPNVKRQGQTDYRLKPLILNKKKRRQGYGK